MVNEDEERCRAVLDLRSHAKHDRICPRRRAEPATAGPFLHPGLLHTQTDLARIKQKVEEGAQPYLDGWNQLVNSPYSQAGWTPRATATIVRGGAGDNVALLYNDAARAYQNALRWKISGSMAHGDTARDILNAWSATLTTVTGNADRYLAAGLNGYQLANAAELMRDYPGFDVSRMQNMLLNVFYKPLNERFLIGNEYGRDHNDAFIQNYWANWDLSNMAATVAIGIFATDGTSTTSASSISSLGQETARFITRYHSCIRTASPNGRNLDAIRHTPNWESV